MSIEQLRTDNARLLPSEFSGYDPANIKHCRQALARRVEQHVQKGMSYDKAWSTANAADDMKPFTDTINRNAPGTTLNAATGQSSAEDLVNRGNKVRLLVGQRMALCNEDYTTAFIAVRNNPDNAALFQAMQGAGDGKGVKTTRDGDTTTTIIPGQFAAATV